MTANGSAHQKPFPPLKTDGATATSSLGGKSFIFSRNEMEARGWQLLHRKSNFLNHMQCYHDVRQSSS